MHPNTPTYWLCTTPRSGSSALADALARTGVAGTPTEYFNSRFWPDLFTRFSVTTERDYIDAVIRKTTTPNGVFGVKMMLDSDAQPTFRALREMHCTPNLSDADIIKHAFPDTKFIFLTRRDKVLQAVSYCRAQQSGIWNRYHRKEKVDYPNEQYSFAELDARVQDLVLHEARWQAFFDAFSNPPYTLVYEDYIRDPEATIRRVVDFLGLTLPRDWSLPQLTLEKLGDATSVAWAERYYQETQNYRSLFTSG